MNRREFLFSTTAALVARVHPDGVIEEVKVASSLQFEVLIEDLITERLRLAQAAVKASIEAEIRQAFFYGEGSGPPLGILDPYGPYAGCVTVQVEEAQSYEKYRFLT